MKDLDYTVVEDVKNEGAEYHRSAFRRGYHHVSLGIQKESYEGKFGKGYIISYPSTRKGLGNRFSNKYHVIEYYIFG